MTREAPITDVRVSAYRVPTDAPEADGTIEWDSTTIVIAEADAAGATGLGYAYGAQATARFAADTLVSFVRGQDALDTNAVWNAMTRAVRNVGRAGIASTAISAIDAALWDLKGRLLGVPVALLLGAARARVPAYGSGGFTSYTQRRLDEQLAGWVAAGLTRVKMKVGRSPRDDLARVASARAAIGPDAELFVDANGGYTRSMALGQAERFATAGVSWFEEPVSSDDLDGLALLVDRAPAGMAIAAGEYAANVYDFRRLLEMRAVHVLQADATRCGGVTGFLKAAALSEAWNTPLSAHTAPSLHVQICSAIAHAAHIEYFHDHARIESLLFDGAAHPVDGALGIDRARPGLGLDLKRSDADPFRVA